MHDLYLPTFYARSLRVIWKRTRICLSLHVVSTAPYCEGGEGGPEPLRNATEAGEDPVALHGLLLRPARPFLLRFVCTVLER